MSGPFMMQIDDCIDVSLSQELIRRQSETNSTTTKSNPNSVMKIKLSCGPDFIGVGIERTRIPSLSNQTLIGTKVLQNLLYSFYFSSIIDLCSLRGFLRTSLCGMASWFSPQGVVRYVFIDYLTS